MTNLSLHELVHFVEAAEHASKIGGDILEQYWGKLSYIREKSAPGDLVTEADQASEAAIIGFLTSRFPNHSILSEEAGLSEISKADYMWIIDPLDGTTNYTHQHPMVCISIGLVYQGEPIVGVIYNPIHRELYIAAKGRGASLNGKPIHVSNIDTIQKSLLATGFAYDRRDTSDNNYAEFVHFTQLSQGVRREGSAALDLAYVAAGRFDGYWERGVKPWDMAAGVVIVREAGGVVTAYDGSPLVMGSGRILATNGKIHATAIKELSEINKFRN